MGRVGACDMGFDIRQRVCHDCEDREIYIRDDGTPYNCHNHCEKYAEEVRQLREYNAKRQDAIKMRSEVLGYMKDKKKAMRQKYGR